MLKSPLLVFRLSIDCKGRFFMQKLWQKGKIKLEKEVEIFETKDDILLDSKLVPYDIEGSLAHAKMLNKLGILSKTEILKIQKGLSEILKLNKKGKFNLQLGEEDIHTKIENYLTSKHGEVGKKIHTARSRNDQVLTAIRLYEKDNLYKIKNELQGLILSFKEFSKKYGHFKMPGYTHMQKAMPSSIGLWTESFIESLEDDIKYVEFTISLIDQSPLGSGAGYGLPIKLDRKYTSKLLGFSKVQENPIYCQNSRGKFEGIILSSLVNVLFTINKFASDILLFNTSEFGFFQSSDKVTTGSSIMPQKKNLDLAELLRSKVHLIIGNYTKVVSLSSNLISGYNRDFQDTKKPLMESLEITTDSLKISQVLLSNLKPNKEKLEAAMTKELYATEKALKLTLKGVSFREAYRKVGFEIQSRKRGE